MVISVFTVLNYILVLGTLLYLYIIRISDCVLKQIFELVSYNDISKMHSLQRLLSVNMMIICMLFIYCIVFFIYCVLCMLYVCCYVNLRVYCQQCRFQCSFQRSHTCQFQVHLGQLKSKCIQSKLDYSDPLQILGCNHVSFYCIFNVMFLLTLCTVSKVIGAVIHTILTGMSP